MGDESPLKRISLMVREDHYTKLSESGINVSGLVRDLIDDYLSEHKITLRVSEETKGLYDRIVSNTGSSDEEIEQYLKEALRSLLRYKIRSMQELESQAFGKDK